MGFYLYGRSRMLLLEFVQMNVIIQHIIFKNSAKND